MNANALAHTFDYVFVIQIKFILLTRCPYLSSPGTYTPFVYSNGAYTSIAAPPSGALVFALGINDLGQIVGSIHDSNTAPQNLAFVYSGGTNGTYTILNDPIGTHETRAYSINSSGQVVGFSDGSGNLHGFLYSGGSNGTYSTIIPPQAAPENYSIDLSINNTGQIVGETNFNNEYHGFEYSGGAYTIIDDPLAPAGHSSVATGINDLGQIVGYYSDSNNVTHSFLYSGGKYINIDDPLATGGTFATGINDAGEIVGYYIDASGTHGFVASVNDHGHHHIQNITLAQSTANFGTSNSGVAPLASTQSITPESHTTHDTFVFAANLGQQTAGQNEVQLPRSEMAASVSQDVHPMGQDTGIAHDAIDVSAALDHVLASHLHAAQNFHLV